MHQNIVAYVLIGVAVALAVIAVSYMSTTTDPVVNKKRKTMALVYGLVALAFFSAGLYMLLHKPKIQE